jgi:hypothetical protein
VFGSAEQDWLIMKTHEIALNFEMLLKRLNLNDSRITVEISSETVQALVEVCSSLQRAPNLELDQLHLVKRANDVAGSLRGLVALSKYDKQRWLELIDEFNLPIELNSKASSRDIVGKLLAYLDDNPDALKNSRKTKYKPESATLEDTLDKLINFR